MHVQQRRRTGAAWHRGRQHNWTFAGSDDGGRRAAAIYTLIETVKLKRRQSASLAGRRPGALAGSSGQADRRVPAVELEARAPAKGRRVAASGHLPRIVNGRIHGLRRMRIKIKPVLPKSNKQRGFLEGAVIRLVTFYQQGMDYRSSEDNRRVREWL
jgi:hypothetical protein